MPSRDDLVAARDDVAVFARVIGRPLTVWQAGALALLVRLTVIVAPRQTGKSRTLAVAALWWAFRRPGQRVMIVSAGEEGAKRLLAEIRAIAAASPLLAGSVVDEQVGLLTLTNGSEVRSVPASERQVRGWTVDLLLVDEAAMVEDDLLLGAALPTTAARPDARVLLASSPNGRSGAFFDFAMRGLAGDEHVDTFRWRLADASWITPATIANLRAALPPERAAAELDGEFVDITGDDFALITGDWIVQARGRTLQASGSWTVGVDVARFGRDRTVAYARRAGRVRRLLEAQGLDTVAVAGRVVGELHEQLAVPPHPVQVVVDDTGVGGGVTDQLRHRGVSVRPFIAAERARRPERFANLRAEAAWTLRLAFERGDVDLDPDDRDLAGQLEAARYSYDERGRVLMGSKRRMAKSPDHLDAVVMCFVGWTVPEQRFDAAAFERQLMVVEGLRRMGVTAAGFGAAASAQLEEAAYQAELRRRDRAQDQARAGRAGGRDVLLDDVDLLEVPW